MVKVKETKKEFDFNNIPKVHNLVNRVAQIIVGDVKGGVAKGLDIKDKKFKPLKPATIKAKQRSGSSTPNKPLLDTHRMVGKDAKGGSARGMDFTGGTGIYIKPHATRGKHRATIRIPADRQYIGGIHNEGLGDMPKREWFGISKRAEKRADKMVREWMRLLFKV